MTDSAAQYNRFAWLYNRRWGTFATEILPVLNQLGLDGLPAGAPVLDLACGTGQLAAHLHQRGFQVTGVDNAAEMLLYARQNAPDVNFILADARSFTVDTPQQLITCTYDSLNHLLTLADLTAAFRQVYAALQSGGRFIFDLNMAEGYAARWRGWFGIVDDDDCAIVESHFNPESGVANMAMTFFVRERALWQRHDVAFTQQAYSREQVETALKAVGFGSVDSFFMQAGALQAGEGGRTFFVAQKA